MASLAGYILHIRNLERSLERKKRAFGRMVENQEQAVAMLRRSESERERAIRRLNELQNVHHDFLREHDRLLREHDQIVRENRKLADEIRLSLSRIRDLQDEVEQLRERDPRSTERRITERRGMERRWSQRGEWYEPCNFKEPGDE